MYRSVQYPMASRFTNNNVGIQSLNTNSNQLQVFPNPVRNGELLNLTKETSVEVFNLLGEKVLAINNATYIKTSEMKSGVYFIKTLAGEHTKFIV
ncbi:MAG: T9SS type A sorting domain-containing protein, partial [Bacteroidia bacterium]